MSYNLFNMFRNYFNIDKKWSEGNAIKQNDIFFKNGLDRILALKKLNEFTQRLFGLEYNENRGMWSEHLVIFSALSLCKDINIRSILEIGTFKGETTLILSELFPDARIMTIDLKQEKLKNIKEYSYATNNPEKDFIKLRNKLITQKKNINFIEMDSLNLFNSNEIFDLVWIDGAHGFPFVAIDITNSLRMTSENGIILCDDVFLTSKKQNMMTESTATWITLQKYQEQSNIKVHLFLKRISQKNNKYIALVKK